MFFGLNSNVENLIMSSGTLSTYPININSIIALSVGIDGDLSFNNNIWKVISIIVFIKHPI
jgi:hypothetical protein